MHGGTRTYETCHVVIRTPHGVFTARAGIASHLPVPLLIGRDCPIFRRLWDLARESQGRRGAVAAAAREGRRLRQGCSRRRRRRPNTTRYLHGRVPRRPEAWTKGGGGLVVDGVYSRHPLSGYQRPNLAVKECGIPPLKPRPGRVHTHTHTHTFFL